MKDIKDLKKIYRTVNEGNFPEELIIKLKKVDDLRYGENPNQPGAVYKVDGVSLAELTNLRLLKSGKGGPSATNILDVTRALEILKFFNSKSCAVMKHLIPSGFSTQYKDEGLAEIYKKARDSDARSAFGSVVVFNREVDKKTAEEIMTSYVEAVAAPGFEKDAEEILSSKKNMRLFLFSNLDKIPKFAGDDVKGIFDLKVMNTGNLVVQVPYLSKIKSKEELILQPMIKNDGGEISVKREPTEQELKDLLTAWYINIGVRSNGIVIVKNGVTLAVGSGQQERVGAVEQAILKAYQKALDRASVDYDAMNVVVAKDKLSENPLKGAVLASDGFFPFRDSVDLVTKHGISAVIQPGGSVRDLEVIEAVNEHDMAMVFTTERCFGHF
ncbi:IMP cyclohydrolase [Candidatus Woesearchaeota archaeon]|nr:IMP cyclohydrolase [Candidatus Woesearchaeota archaeon]